MTMEPLSTMERRAPEAGRIRTGVKTARAMKAINTFRFTSSHRSAIEELAELYGGNVQPWSDGITKGDQWEVITEAKSIEIFLVPGGLSTHYELWGKGGLSRRCDGEMCEVPTSGPEPEMAQTPCLCNRKGLAECKPYTRLNVVLPRINFYGQWRLETKGWNAAKELPGMHDMVAQLASSGTMVRAFLNLEERSRRRNNTTKHFIVPTISMAMTPDQILSGAGKAQPQLEAVPLIELDNPHPDDVIGPEGEVLQPEIIMTEEDDRLVEAQVRDIAQAYDLPPALFVEGVWAATGGDTAAIRAMINRVAQGKIEPTEVTSQGEIKWKQL